MEENNKGYLLALRYLRFRLRSIAEIQTYLVKKRIPQEEIEKTITQLLQQKFLDDKRFALSWVNARQHAKPKSMWLLKRELQQKGIAEDIMENVLTNPDEKIDDAANAKTLLERKKEQFNNFSREVLCRRAGGYLGRRGFSANVIKEAIDAVFGK
ncbi:MAG TPA: regulatory protein RecX [Patescibacteria group bacterium]|nr:regulatory protein RecX [Patescibacteria group bacterium]